MCFEINDAVVRGYCDWYTSLSGKKVTESKLNDLHRRAYWRVETMPSFTSHPRSRTCRRRATDRDFVTFLEHCRDTPSSDPGKQLLPSIRATAMIDTGGLRNVANPK